jgi:hypothetical protein
VNIVPSSIYIISAIFIYQTTNDAINLRPISERISTFPKMTILSVQIQGNFARLFSIEINRKIFIYYIIICIIELFITKKFLLFKEISVTVAILDRGRDLYRPVRYSLIWPIVRFLNDIFVKTSLICIFNKNWQNYKFHIHVRTGKYVIEICVLLPIDVLYSNISQP